jgi:hypothetical protein
MLNIVDLGLVDTSEVWSQRHSHQVYAGKFDALVEVDTWLLATGPHKLARTTLSERQSEATYGEHCHTLGSCHRPVPV